jgi:hypothetical protein
MPDEERYDIGTIFHDDLDAGEQLEAEIVADRERRMALPRFEDCVFESPIGKLRLFVCFVRGEQLGNAVGLGFTALEAFEDLLRHKKFVQEQEVLWCACAGDRFGEPREIN